MRHSALPHKLPEAPVLTLTGTEAELKLLDRLQRYDIISSVYLTHGMGYFGAKLLTRIYKSQAAGVAEYASPWAIKRNVNYPVTIFPIGQRLLALNGRWINRARGTDDFPHKYYRSTIEYLFDYAAEVTPGLTAKTLQDVLDHPNCPEGETRQEKDFPHRLYLRMYNAKKHELYAAPDSFRGFNYRGLADTYFFIEADRDTEPLTTDTVRQSIRQKIDNYDAFFERGGLKERYGLEQATVLWVTTNEARARALLRQFKASKFPKRHAVAVFPDFTQELPPPSDAMITQEWARAVGGPLVILDTLKATAERKRHVRRKEGSASEGAGADN
jgi:hypothetical protein